MVKNLIDGDFHGPLYVVNPKETAVQGLKSYAHVNDIPETDLAILAVPPKACQESIKVLCEDKNTKAFIIISAGFAEGGEEGKKAELEVVEMINKHQGALIGPNCIGVLNQHYNGVFTSPIPRLHPDGCDLISSSGGVATFIMEAGILNGLRFSSVFSVGNAAQIGIEEVLEYLDDHYEHGESSPIKLLYLETIRNPTKLLKHAASLINKGARIAAIKSGSTKAGSRAAASHTGAIANSDMAVRALFRKAGIVYCSSREELITVACVFNNKELKGKNIAVITHAGGNAVMLSDALISSGMEVPPIEGPDAEDLLSFLHKGSSVGNPIDFLATGTAEQLGIIIDYCEHKFHHIDGMVVVFGSAGLLDVANVYDVLRVKLDVCQKPIFPVLPSLINAHDEIQNFLSKGHVNFPDEVDLGIALGAIYHTPKPEIITYKALTEDLALKELIEGQANGFLPDEVCFDLLEHVGIPVARPQICLSKEASILAAASKGYPVVAKVVGPLHKSDVNGVHLNIRTPQGMHQAYDQLMAIEGAESVMVQSMQKGLEIFIGAKYEQGLGHLVMFGLGGIFVEVFKDVRAGLTPLREHEINLMLKKLQAYPLIKGTRGKDGINEQLFVKLIIKVSKLIEQLPEIKELDINPLMASGDSITAVDARIRIERT